MRTIYSTLLFAGLTAHALAQQPCDNLNAGFQVTADGHVATFHSNGSTTQHYIWSFGDGTHGDGPMPVHTYAGPGTYTVCLVVWAWNEQAQDTCYADHCESVVITGGDPCDQLSACFVPNDYGKGSFFFDNCSAGPLWNGARMELRRWNYKFCYQCRAPL